MNNKYNELNKLINNDFKKSVYIHANFFSSPNHFKLSERLMKYYYSCLHGLVRVGRVNWN